MNKINWNTTQEEMFLIRDISKRAMSLDLDSAKDFEKISMDITACHLNGTPLKLKELLDSDNSDFIHDISGISCYIDRSTGRLTNCFLPRYSN